MRPNRLVVRAYVSRGSWLWLATRAVVSAGFLLAETSPIPLPAAVVVEIILLSVAVCFLDTYRHRERALLGNLGLRPLMLAVLFAGPAVIGESALWLGATALQ